MQSCIRIYISSITWDISSCFLIPLSYWLYFIIFSNSFWESCMPSFLRYNLQRLLRLIYIRLCILYTFRMWNLLIFWSFSWTMLRILKICCMWNQFRLSKSWIIVIICLVSIKFSLSSFSSIIVHRCGWYCRCRFWSKCYKSSIIVFSFSIICFLIAKESLFAGILSCQSGSFTHWCVTIFKYRAFPITLISSSWSMNIYSFTIISFNLDCWCRLILVIYFYSFFLFGTCNFNRFFTCIDKFIFLLKNHRWLNSLSTWWLNRCSFISKNIWILKRIGNRYSRNKRTSRFIRPFLCNTWSSWLISGRSISC